MYTALRLETFEAGKLTAKLSPTAGSLATTARRLLISDRVTELRFLVDTGADVSVILVTMRNRT